MKIRNLALVVGMALALPLFAQNGGAPGGAAPGGGGAPGGGAAAGGGGGAMPAGVAFKTDGFFAQVNTSKSGKITAEEWKAAGLKDMVFSMVDTKKTGSITPEMLAATKFPAAIDGNKDGVLTVDEMIAFDKTMGSGGGGAPGGGGGAPAGGGGAPGGGAPGGGAPGGGGPPQQ
jgi:hypothetical protein